MTIPFALDLGRIFTAPEPWAALAEEREKGWIAQSPFGVHVLGFDAAVEILRDRRFEIDVTTVLDGAGITDPQIRSLWVSALLGSPTHVHDRLRRLVAPYFSRKVVTYLRAYVVALIERLADELAEAGTVDAVGGFAARIPPLVFARMIGAPEEDADQIGRWSATIMQIFARDPARAPQIEAAERALAEYVDQFIAARRANPGGDDMISALLAAEESGDRLTSDELRAVVVEALKASADSTSTSLSALLYAAALHPESWRALRDDPGGIPAYVEETGRMWPRIVHIPRTALVDVEWRGLRLPAGTDVHVSVPSALRDPAAFPDPLRFDPTRGAPVAHNLNFGSGAHMCVGAALARMQLGAALEVLTRAWPRVELVGPPRIDTTFGAVTFEYLPLRVG
ncbi:cytochrome P450 [Actinocorallia sp. A-T 12471]|uniref:cytochrome P450 n=1 Tax=Actinocorallia sp. A-T 12471 TaxID=3089813 RepID=UPI0029CD425C|nr:cytochrome P450 [Actinocorallia sp. A-T 12471]MDX6741653.1 cytochrome P450 [Actinocorallia sp. A-T 12471]